MATSQEFTDKLDGQLWELYQAAQLKGENLSLIVRYGDGFHDESLKEILALGGTVQRDIPRLNSLVISLIARAIVDLAKAPSVRDIGREEKYAVA